METTRRDFLGAIAANAAMLGAMPLSFDLMATAAHAAPPQGEKWDVSWTSKVNGKHKAIFDVPEVDSGYGVWRAGMWEPQYHATQGAKPAETATVLVLRHNALVLGFNQEFWDKYDIGNHDKVTHPITQQSTTSNPVLLSSAKNEVPAQFDAFALPNFLAKGGIVLACNVALQFFSAGLAQQAGISEDEARKLATAALLPGVKLQPSGVFACVLAQEAGCRYVRAS